MKMIIWSVVVTIGVALSGLNVFAQSPPAPELLRNTMKSYIKLLAAGDTDGIMNLYGENPSVEDPVGGNPIIGREAVRAFYTGAGAIKVEIVGPVVIAGVEGAMRIIAQLEMAALTGFIDVIETMTFDDQGRIVSMRAYWSPSEIRQER